MGETRQTEGSLAIGGETKAMHGRWTVERLFAWLQVFRRLVTRYEYHIDNFLGWSDSGA